MKFKVYRDDLDPSLYIYSDNIPKYSTSPMHINYYAEIVVCLEGSIKITVEDRERFLTAGDGTFIYPLEPHSFTDGKIRVFCFSPLIFGDLLQRLPISSKSVGKISGACLAYVDYLTEKPLSFPENEREMQLVLRSLLYDIPTVKSVRDRSLAICRGISYLEQHYTEKITLESFAAAIGVNRHYACQMFPKYLNGVTFSQVLNQIRIHRAIKLLAQTSVSNAAMESGFGSIRQFNRVFLELTTTTPTRYQKSMNLAKYEERLIL